MKKARMVLSLFCTALFFTCLNSFADSADSKKEHYVKQDCQTLEAKSLLSKKMVPALITASKTHRLIDPATVVTPSCFVNQGKTKVILSQNKRALILADISSTDDRFKNIYLLQPVLKQADVMDKQVFIMAAPAAAQQGIEITETPTPSMLAYLKKVQIWEQQQQQEKRRSEQNESNNNPLDSLDSLYSLYSAGSALFHDVRIDDLLGFEPYNTRSVEVYR